MNTVYVSAELAHWAMKAGFSQSTGDEDGSLCFYNDGGEERYYLRWSQSEAGRILVTNASRSSDEEFVFSAQRLEVAERYFWGFFGTAIRSRTGLARLRVPVRSDAVATGYRIDTTNSGHTDLVDRDGTRIMTAGNDVSDIALLVKTSHWLSATIPALTASYLDPAGKPLFPLQSQETAV